MKNTLLICLLVVSMLVLPSAINSKKNRHHSHPLRRRFKEDPPAAPPAADAPPADAPPAEGDKPKEGEEGKDKPPAGPPQLQDEMLPPNSMAVKQCNQVVNAKGTFIVDLWNTTLRGPMVFIMNVYTLSIFTKDTPDSLLNSIDMAFVSDIAEIEGAPECLVITSKQENKTLIPCFDTEELKPEAIKAYEMFKKCKDTPEEEKLTVCEMEAKLKEEMKAAAAGGDKKEGEEGDKKEEAKPAEPAAPAARKRRKRLL